MIFQHEKNESKESQIFSINTVQKHILFIYLFTGGGGEVGVGQKIRGWKKTEPPSPSREKKKKKGKKPLTNQTNQSTKQNTTKNPHKLPPAHPQKNPKHTRKEKKHRKPHQNPPKSGTNLWREICWIHLKQTEHLYVIPQLWWAKNEVHCHPPFPALEHNIILLNDQCVGCFTTYPIAWHSQQWLALLDTANPNSYQRILTQGNTVRDSRNFSLMSPNLGKKNTNPSRDFAGPVIAFLCL